MYQSKKVLHEHKRLTAHGIASSGFKWGGRSRRAPPTDQNFFNFIRFLQKMYKYIGSAPPPTTSPGSAPVSSTCSSVWGGVKGLVRGTPWLGGGGHLFIACRSSVLARGGRPAPSWPGLPNFQAGLGGILQKVPGIKGYTHPQKGPGNTPPVKQLLKTYPSLLLRTRTATNLLLLPPAYEVPGKVIGFFAIGKSDRNKM